MVLAFVGAKLFRLRPKILTKRLTSKILIAYSGNVDNVQNCTCVYYTLCNSTLYQKTDDVSCSNEVDVCCIGYSASATPPPPTTPLPSYRSCGYRQDNGIVERIDAEFGEHLNCVSWKLAILAIISNNAVFLLGEFPWTVAIFKKVPNVDGKIVYHCGGSLIHPGILIFSWNSYFNQVLWVAILWLFLMCFDTFELFG